MPFTAVHADLGRLDATLNDLGCGLEWQEIYRAKPRPPLSCPECCWPVHAKLSPRRNRYFAHDADRSTECQLSAESPEHHFTKLELAGAIREVGWRAELEHRAPDGSWRADVLAVSPTGERRIAWEAQLSPITDDDLRERTDRYAADGIGVCWVTPRGRVPWLGSTPAMRIAAPERRGAPWTIADGIFWFDEKRGSWIRVQDTALMSAVRWVCEGGITAHEVMPRYRRVLLSDVEYPSTSRRSVVWTTVRSQQTEAQHEVMRQRQDVLKAQRLEREAAAEQRRQEKESAQRAEEARRRAVQAQADRKAAEARRAQEAAEAARRYQERVRQWEAERRREEEERHRRVEEARLAEEQRQEEARRELAAAQAWWSGVSREQFQDFLDAVAAHALKNCSAPARPRGKLLLEPQFAYGIPVYVGSTLYGLLRPYPPALSTGRVTYAPWIIMRNGREAALAREHDTARDRIVYFELPDHEQMSLL
ncbi:MULTISPECIES: competence protein CoiA family protein [unclassified Streptomyces]|uniref:competence protein CoiA n=1 Tax=unclassified Streptomyces TaxID=2593676 RepID=UPI00362E6629